MSLACAHGLLTGVVNVNLLGI